MPHRRRPEYDRNHPLHATLRVIPGLPSLRIARIARAIRVRLAAGSGPTFRVVQYSIQSNHVHLLAEADSKHALTRGMQGLGIRLAKALNRLFGRRGRVLSDRFHARALQTPTEVRNGLVYVLLNGRKHGVSGPGIDPCSSGWWFTGWRERIAMPAEPSPVARARTWLLAAGWRRRGLLSIFDRPVQRRRR